MALQIAITGGVKNASLQLGDVAYYAVLEPQIGTGTGNMKYSDEFTKIGVITEINMENKTIVVENEINTPAPQDFLMFSKDKSANNTSLLGYFAEIKLNNNSPIAAELFSLASEITPSSK